MKLLEPFSSGTVYGDNNNGTRALTAKPASYTDVTGKTVTVPIKTYLTMYSGGKPKLDTSAPVTAPIAVGIYGIQATITDDNYKWTSENGNANVINVYLIVYPKPDAVYVGDSASDVKLTTANASNVSGYNWTVDTTYSDFESSQPGTTVANVRNTQKSGAAMSADLTIPVTVKSVLF